MLKIVSFSLFLIPQELNHIVVFLLGTIAFPAGYGASVYFRYRSEEGQEHDWQLLGYLSNEKASSIFRVAGLKPKIFQSSAVNGSSQNHMLSGHQVTLFNSFNTAGNGANGVNAGQGSTAIAQIGISIEPLQNIEQAVVNNGGIATNTVSVGAVASMSGKLIGNLYDYLSSFASGGINFGNAPCVPLSVLDKWRDNLSRKLERDPNFLKT